ncbi:MAG: SdrD B-like domain-containing protein, partial [Desulfuromonadaceae bacterium]|nr:SdrD B-like domain-containing protein [Desulfuromonadaceae bacterium]
TNNGPGTSSVTRLTNTLPADMEFISGSPVTWTNAVDGSSGSCVVSGQALSCDFGSVSDTAVAVVTAPVRFVQYPSGGTLQNCATATTNQVDPVSGNNVSACGTVNVIRSSIAGVVFVDSNNNGIQDTGETGIAGTPVTLTGTDAYDNAVNITLNTAADGSFLFSNQSGGAQTDALGYLNAANASGYTLTQSLPTSYFDGLDSIGTASGNHAQDGSVSSTDLITAITLGRETAAIDYQFGEIAAASLAGRVCVDSNDNGVCEIGEVGIQGVSISLSGKTVNDVDVCTLIPSCTVQTDALGDYQITLPTSDATGYTLTQQANSSSPLNAFADGKDSAGSLSGTANNNPTGSDSISAIVVTSNANGTAYDFGERGSSLSGLVYLDSNDDATRDPDEPGIPGVSVTVSGKTPDGVDICPPGSPSLLPLSACTTVTGADGNYSFSGLPNGTYKVTENQPAGYDDGKDTAGTGGGTPGAIGTDEISNVTINGSDISGYLFGEKINTVLPGSATVSGKVWFESSSRDKTQNSGERGLEGWQVTAHNNTGLLIATATTDSNGAYQFDLPAGGYSLAFKHPVSGALYGTPVAQDPTPANGSVDLANRTIAINVVGGTNIIEQNLPVDPSGVVYDAVTRQPVAGAVVQINGPMGFDPQLHLVGGAAAAQQMTGTDGFYQFFLTPSAPAGDYTLVTTAPAGYLQAPSALIPVCQATLAVGNSGAPQLVQNSSLAPSAGVAMHDPASCPSNSGGLAIGSNTTQYYSRFNLNNSSDVINNHIPLDPILGGAIVMTKTTPKVNVTRGELVPYTLTARNTLTSTLSNIVIEDQLPPGFKYIAGSAQIDGVLVEPLLEGRRLRFPERTLNGGQTLIIKMLLVVGSGVGFNEYVNQTWALNLLANARVSNVASASVRVVADPTFDCSDLIGTVYDDKNRNGYQDESEPGIAGARVATPKGWLVTSDQYGRFHIACADVPSEMRGSNFILKADERSLPSGYRITTENPRVVRMTQGRLVKANFGASIHRVVRLDLNSEAFTADNTLTELYQARLPEVLTLLYAEPSILRIAYRMPVDGEVKDARKRVSHVRDWFKSQWEPEECCYDLQVEEEIVPVTDSVEVIR